MKRLLNNKRGFAFPTVLGTFVLVTGLVAGLFIMVMNMTMMISSDAETSEELFTTRNKIDFFLDNIRANNTLNEDLQAYLGLEVDQIGNSDWYILFDPNHGHQVSSRFQMSSTDGSVGSVGSVTDIEDMMKNVTNVIPPPLSNNPPTFEEDTVIDGDWTINSGLFTLGSTITVAEGAILFIDGDLTLQSTLSIWAGNEITGTVCVLGSLTIDTTLSRTTYVDGDFCIKDDLVLITRGSGDIVFTGNTIAFGSGRFEAIGSANIDMNGDLVILDNLSLLNRSNSGDIRINGDIVVYGSMDMQLQASSGWDIWGNGDIELSGSLIIQDNLTINNSSYNGDVIINSNTIVLDSTNVTLVNGPGGLFGLLRQPGHVTINAHLSVQEDLVLTNTRSQSNIRITGDTYVLGDITPTAPTQRIIYTRVMNSDVLFEMPPLNVGSSIIDIIR